MSAPLRILLVDDEAPARERLRTVLSDLAPGLPNGIVAEAADGLAALGQVEMLGAGAIDLALIDVRMPRMDGLELAQHLIRLPDPPAIVFTTAYDHYAVQAFDLAAVDYLLKPIRAERLRQALVKVLERRVPALPSGGAAARNLDVVAAGDEAAGLVQTIDEINPEARRYLSCHERGKLLLVAVDEVIYLRADTKYVMARTVEREYLLTESLLTLETEFGERFIRLHRGVLAARGALIGFEKGHDGDGRNEQWLALLKGLDERLPISRRHWPQVKEFARHLAGE